MANNGYPIRVQHIFLRELACDGSVLPLEDGGCGFWLRGNKETQIDAGINFETVAAIVGECYRKSAENNVGGADGVINLGCKFTYSELSATFIKGMHESTGLGGTIQTSFDKPGEEDCYTCPKEESTECDREFALMAVYCEVDCDDKVIGQKIMVIRRISEATLSNRKRIGGGNVDAFGGDISISIETNDGFGYGPGDLLVSDDGGEPECASVTCDIECPADLDLTYLDEQCGCAAVLSGCKITAETLVSYPELLPIGLLVL